MSEKFIKYMENNFYLLLSLLVFSNVIIGCNNENNVLNPDIKYNENESKGESEDIDKNFEKDKVVNDDHDIDHADYDSNEVRTVNVIPTNQKKCYDNEKEIDCPLKGELFFGQDANYSNQDRVFTITTTDSEEEILDLFTGLVWQRKLPETDIQKTYPLKTATDYCNDLDYAGNSDWRLPTVEELSSLLDYGRSNPSVDDSIFPFNFDINYFWADSSPFDEYEAWAIDFASGYLSYITKTIFDEEYCVICVRGDSYISDALNTSTSTINQDDIIKDLKTGLIWQKTLPAIYDNCSSGTPSGESCLWFEALEYCEKLNYAGYSDWRLPDVNELRSSIDFSKDSSIFDKVNSLWSSTTFNYDHTQAWYISTSPHKWAMDKTVGLRVRCVR